MEKNINDELKDIQKVKLSDVATIKTSKRVLTSDYKSIGIPFLKGSDLTWVENKAGLDSDINYITRQKFDELREKSGFPKEGDILVTGNGTIGKTFLVSTKDEFYFKDGVLWVTDITCNKEFLYTYIREHVLSYVEKLSHGSTITNLNIETLRSLPIPQLDIVEQEKIAKLLSSIDDLIEQSSELEKLYISRKESYMQKIFCDTQEVLCEVHTLDNVFETITDYVAAGSFADVKKNVTYRSGPDYAMLVRCTDLKSKFTSKEFVYVDKHAFDFLYRVNIDEDCIVLPNIGNIGESYFCNKTVLPYEHNILGPNTIMVRSKKNSNKFLYYYTQTKLFRDDLLKIAGGSGMLKFNKTDLKKIKIQIPVDYNYQEKIANLLSSMDNLIDYQNNITDECKELKKYYLNLIFK